MLIVLSVGIKFLRSLILRSGFPKIIFSRNSNFFVRNSQIFGSKDWPINCTQKGQVCFQQQKGVARGSSFFFISKMMEQWLQDDTALVYIRRIHPLRCFMQCLHEVWIDCLQVSAVGKECRQATASRTWLPGCSPSFQVSLGILVAAFVSNGRV